jgi:G6PDH family F420-dependent oxidoreductase
MAEIGYALSSEEHSPLDLVNNARRAEEVGFDFLMISDHYHPWISDQGHSSFVWSVIGGISQATERIRLGTGVTCPIIRIHPAILAQAAATAACMMPGRFFFGVGTGENLNEHIFGDRWPPHDIRLEMFDEAIHIMRTLWEGDTVSHWGDYYTVEDARVFDIPDEPIQVFIAAYGPKTIEFAGTVGDGVIGLSTKAEDIQLFEESGGRGKPKVTQVTVCYAESEKKGRQIVKEIWPTSGLTGELSQELRTFAHFKQAVEPLTEEQIVGETPCGPDPEVHIKAIQKQIDAGFEMVYLHQIGRDQEGFFRFYEKEILPHVQQGQTTARANGKQPAAARRAS